MMKVLMSGLPFCSGEVVARRHVSASGYEIRLLKCVGGPNEPECGDIVFEPSETVDGIVARISPEWRPDLLVCWTPELYPPPREIENSPVKTAAIVSDWNIYSPQFEHNLSRYDVVVSDKAGSIHLRPWKVTPRYFGPIYSHQWGVHRRIPGATRDIDVLFPGNLNAAAHPERCRLLERIASLSDRYKVHLTGELPKEEYGVLLNGAKIVFNRSLRGEMNLRCFEAPACGALLFIEADNLEAREILRDGESAVFYHDDNLLELLRHYLENESERARVAENGYNAVMASAGERRMDAMLAAIVAEQAGGRPFHELPPETKAYAELMQYASSVAPGQRQISASNLPRLRRLYPESVEILVVSGCAGIDSMKSAGAERARVSRSVRSWFMRATALAPDAAALWMNLARLAQGTGDSDVQVSFLERAVMADSCVYGGLLLGAFTDPYYVAWRRALGYGTACVEMLHGAAHARLAHAHLAHARHEKAIVHARKSIELMPDIAQPHRILAQAESALGHYGEAARILEGSLHLTAFDVKHRMALVEACDAAGLRQDAARYAEESARIFHVSRQERFSGEVY